MARDDPLRLDDILDAIEHVEKLVEDYDQRSFRGVDRTTFAALRAEFMTIGEAVKALSVEVRARHTEVGWRDFARLRDALVHEYFRIDRERMWVIINQDLPLLRAAVEAELKRRGDSD